MIVELVRFPSDHPCLLNSTVSEAEFSRQEKPQMLYLCGLDPWLRAIILSRNDKVALVARFGAENASAIGAASRKSVFDSGNIIYAARKEARMAQRSWFSRLLVPGLAFKAAVIGGGYATGGELATFFVPHGAWGGVFEVTKLVA